MLSRPQLDGPASSTRLPPPVPPTPATPASGLPTGPDAGLSPGTAAAAAALTAPAFLPGTMSAPAPSTISGARPVTVAAGLPASLSLRDLTDPRQMRSHEPFANMIWKATHIAKEAALTALLAPDSLPVTQDLKSGSGIQLHVNQARALAGLGLGSLSGERLTWTEAGRQQLRGLAVAARTHCPGTATPDLFSTTDARSQFKFINHAVHDVIGRAFTSQFTAAQTTPAQMPSAQATQSVSRPPEKKYRPLPRSTSPAGDMPALEPATPAAPVLAPIESPTDDDTPPPLVRPDEVPHVEATPAPAVEPWKDVKATTDCPLNRLVGAIFDPTGRSRHDGEHHVYPSLAGRPGISDASFAYMKTDLAEKCQALGMGTYERPSGARPYGIFKWHAAFLAWAKPQYKALESAGLLRSEQFSSAATAFVRARNPYATGKRGSS